MIDALIAGKLYGQAQQRDGANGKPFTTAKVRASVGEGEPLFVNVIAFSHSVQETLLSLGDGESVALSGELTPKVWTDKEGNTRPAVDLVAHAVLSIYQGSRDR
ncbi:single-stranded DNA-binding protein [Ottowia thiooxydans]|uniref:single-stranded DNA-binding protein n=1 Tax=Ottowia thiooxydans TaxID=219182 RepID=UPI0003FB79C7|nr:single-stranded DNA-binding protein [Ottowia thiooxydans]